MSCPGRSACVYGALCDRAADSAPPDRTPAQSSWNGNGRFVSRSNQCRRRDSDRESSTLRGSREVGAAYIASQILIDRLRRYIVGKEILIPAVAT